ncbi:hypothetical protein ADL28_39835 [Streptomyces violaceusniger]|uniref:Uncharacterized protein n=1 Tax=Streptomyces violaceusniger TaxID=68280 RepID=A0A0X3VM46_STRVO|nr:hypothetical protein ADL28_39835 [Streptomyces violaceusniger]
MLLEFVRARLAGLPGGPAPWTAADGLGPSRPQIWCRSRPCAVVRDNASAYVSRWFKGRRGQVARIGVESCSTCRRAARR